MRLEPITFSLQFLIIGIFLYHNVIANSVFIKIRTSGLNTPLSNTAIIACANRCLSDANYSSFCYGFTYENGACVLNYNESIVLNSTTHPFYFAIYAFHDYNSQKCPKIDTAAIHKPYPGTTEPLSIFRHGDAVIRLYDDRRNSSDCVAFCNKAATLPTSVHHSGLQVLLYNAAMSAVYPNLESHQPNQTKLLHLGLKFDLILYQKDFAAGEVQSTDVYHTWRDNSKLDYLYWGAGQPLYQNSGDITSNLCTVLTDEPNGRWVEAPCDDPESVANCICTMPIRKTC